MRSAHFNLSSDEVAGRVASVIRTTGRILILALLATALLPACSQFSKTGRSQKQYEKYIRTSRAAREKQQTKVRRKQQEIPPAEESAPTETITTSDGG